MNTRWFCSWNDRNIFNHCSCPKSKCSFSGWVHQSAFLTLNMSKAPKPNTFSTTTHQDHSRTPMDLQLKNFSHKSWTPMGIQLKNIPSKPRIPQELQLKNIPDKPRTPLELQLKNTQDHGTQEILMQIYDKSINIKEGLMRLRQDLKRKKVEKLVYQDFVLPEPNFVSRTDKQIFYSIKDNIETKAHQTNLTGFVTHIPRAACCREGVRKYWEGYWCEFTFLPQKNRKRDKKVLHKRRSNKEGRDENATVMCPLLVAYGWSFQHFMDTLMPKLIQVYNYIIPADVKIILYEPPHEHRIILEIFQRLGFSISQVVFFNDQKLSADGILDTCVSPKRHPDTWQVMRSMLRIPERVFDGKVKVILLTRSHSRGIKRNILNQEDVLRFLLQRYGTNSVTLFRGGYNLSEALNLFSGAHVVLGSHGGALYNINFCPKGTHVVEIMPATPLFFSNRTGGTKNMFWQQASFLDHIFWRIYEKPEDKQFNMRISMDKLEKLFNKIDAHLKEEYWKTVATLFIDCQDIKILWNEMKQAKHARPKLAVLFCCSQPENSLVNLYDFSPFDHKKVNKVVVVQESEQQIYRSWLFQKVLVFLSDS